MIRLTSLCVLVAVLWGSNLWGLVFNLVGALIEDPKSPIQRIECIEQCKGIPGRCSCADDDIAWGHHPEASAFGHQQASSHATMPRPVKTPQK
eukprot:502933-Amphidinium_carterae.1